MAVKYHTINNQKTNVRFNKVFLYIFHAVTFLSWMIIPGFVKKIILKQFFIPLKYDPDNMEQQILTRGYRFRVFANQQEIQCWKWGQGAAVIFAHGWNGSGIQFESFIGRLKDRGLTVIVFDGPAHGESEGKIPSYFQMTDAIRAIIRYCQSNKMNITGIIGHSFGAAAVINAVDKEMLSTSLILISPALFLKQMLEKAFRKNGVPLSVFRSIISEFEYKYGYTLANDNPIDLLKNSQNRLLIIHDKEDMVIPYHSVSHAVDQIKNAELFLTTGLKHLKILKSQIVVNKTQEFLERDRDV